MVVLHYRKILLAPNNIGGAQKVKLVNNTIDITVYGCIVLKDIMYDYTMVRITMVTINQALPYEKL